MPERKISNLFRIKNRFLRSVRLERDFEDPDALDNYVATEFVQDCVNRLAQGVKPKSGQRAWRMTGDYGSGKSSFALLMSHWFAGQEANIPSRIRKVTSYGKCGVASPDYVPVLVTASRQALSKSIVGALSHALQEQFGARSKRQIITRLKEASAQEEPPTDEQTLELILDANTEIITEEKGKGLVLIVDELGKFLEFAAQRPEAQDVFFLQSLAETACRSKDEPFFLICLLHQGFSAYAHDLSHSAQREWEKVAGRYDEIVFNQPIDQLGEIISSALNLRSERVPDSAKKELRSLAKATHEFGWFGATNEKRLLEIAASLFPLHPAVLPVLIRAFRRFGQNERSLFSFLLSNEPFGLQAFATSNTVGNGPLYRLSDFYDYLRTNLGHRLAALSYRSYWTLIESVIDSYAGEDELQVQILKTVGVLNLLNDGDILPLEDAIVCSVAGKDSRLAKNVRSALDVLRKKGVIYDRGRSRGLCLWPHTSVDLDGAFEDARRIIDEPKRVAESIRQYLEVRPIVTRRHYIQTGSLRHFEVRYCSVHKVQAHIDQRQTEADGAIVIPLVESEAERNLAMKLAKDPAWDDLGNWLYAVPLPLGSITSLVVEVQRWEWVAVNTPELNGDRYASEEVTRKIESARNQLIRRVQDLVGLRQSVSSSSLKWYRKRQSLRVKGSRDLMSKLSDIFDKEFESATTIHNELVNRRNLSSAAAAARMRLIERMFTNSHEELLGMDDTKRPPEMSMYLSVLQQSGLHKKRQGEWRISTPRGDADKCNIVPALRRIKEILKSGQESRVNVSELMDELRKPPFGLRDGVIPLLLTAFAIEHEKDVAFYKDGSFQREMTAEAMLVLTKAPTRFEIQYCKIEGVRAELFQKLCSTLDVETPDGRSPELLDIVKPVCVFVAKLPEYVHRTKRLSPLATKVRDAILEAKEPATLLFTELPKACGLDSFAPGTKQNKKQAAAFARSLKSALDELRASFPELLNRMMTELQAAFPSPGSFSEFRRNLSERAMGLLPSLNDEKLKPFCMRVIDDNLPEADWLESVGSCLAYSPPTKWNDSNETKFNGELLDVAARFNRVESVVFDGGIAPTSQRGIRVAITRPDGTEHDQVVHYSPDEEKTLAKLRGQFESILAKNNRLGLAAASEALWSAIQKPDKKDKR